MTNYVIVLKRVAPVTNFFITLLAVREQNYDIEQDFNENWVSETEEKNA